MKSKETGEVFQKPNRLLIPIMSADGTIHSLQAISPQKPEKGSDRFYLAGKRPDIVGAFSFKELKNHEPH